MKIEQSPKPSTIDYGVLATDDDDDDDGAQVQQNPPRTNFSKRVLQIVLLFLAFIITAFISFLAGRHSKAQTRDGLLIPQGNIPEVWYHNLTFSGKPSPESEDAWSSIVPIGRGFVTHPEIAPFISNIAVFHQLHCLHGIRVAYYTTLHQLNLATNSTDPDPFLEKVGANTDNVHMRHCFDYLRHAVMCAADTNLEAVSREERKTTGWGSERICRDYWGVKRWAEEWRNSDDVGIL